MRAGCAEKDLEQLTTAVLIIRKELQGLQEPPEECMRYKSVLNNQDRSHELILVLKC